ncbi:MAG: hypothetical protein ACTSXZ_00590 [Alphaproteobacteria bacterium]
MLPLLAAVAAHMAVLAGGVLRPENISLLWELKYAIGGGAAASALRGLTAAWPDPAAPFVAAALWGLAGLLLMVFAVRQLFSPYLASMLLAVLLLSGYPGWTDLMPTTEVFWLLPVGVLAALLALRLTKRRPGWASRLASLTAGRAWKAAWIVLMVFAVLVVTERVRVGLRVDEGGQFDYAKAGLPLGFDGELGDLRRVQHVSEHVAVLRAMAEKGLDPSRWNHCQLAHGAAARFICRLGLASGTRRTMMDKELRTSVGWRLDRIPRRLGEVGVLFDLSPMVLSPTVGRGGLRYPKLRGVVDGEEAGHWFDTRRSVISRRPKRVEIRGPIFRRAWTNQLWVEVECDDPTDVTMTVNVDGEDLPLIRRRLAAGDRTIERGIVRLERRQRSGIPLVVIVEAPAGMLDFDLFVSPVDAAEMVQAE